MLPDTISVMMLVVDEFERLDIPYFVSGSMASALYGVARSTMDADLVADLGQEKVGALVRALSVDFYIDAEMIRDAIQHRSSFNIIHLNSMFKVDVFITHDRPFDRSQFQRRIQLLIKTDPEQRACIATAEDLILAKLEWYHLGGKVSDRQWRDILGVLKVQSGQLDLDYLHRMAAELDVITLLQKALKEAE
ncbi:MAG: hypothetical protein A2W33_05105 [Chloroflexi bacterium RBG_16_52_11]|nr:MAG: hypothetical protein A2W33_05105 [Chloroflexi bacterium RBG_16_52_11]